jgi:hypothetical protein
VQKQLFQKGILIKEFARKTLDDTKLSIESQCSLPKDVTDLIKNCRGDAGCNFPGLLQCLHRASLELASVAPQEKDLFKEILLALLQYRAAAFHIPNPLTFNKLGEVFARQLHSNEKNAFIAKVDYNDSEENTTTPFDASHWTLDDLPEKTEPEFAIFGISNCSECSKDTFEKIDWKLVLATDINYPFETVKIHIVDENKAITKYKKTVGDLLMGLETNKTVRIMDLLHNGVDSHE